MIDDQPLLLFKEKYRIPSARLQTWDYASPGRYYVTICTKNRIPWFGDVVGGVMRLSGIGRIVDDEWNKTPRIRSNISLDAYVVMPDHFHGIIEIHSTGVETPCQGVSTGIKKWQPGCLGSIINHFKRACTVRIRDMHHPNFAWQPRFYDHVIRSDEDLCRIREYIKNNPLMWHLKGKDAS